jgi:hypothetical protein
MSSANVLGRMLAASASCSPEVRPPITHPALEGRRYTIKQLPPELRPRERLLEAGPAALSNAELLGILFGIGNREKTAVELASEVISTHGDLFGLQNLTACVPKHKDIRTDVSWRPGRRQPAGSVGAIDEALSRRRSADERHKSCIR